MEMRNSVKLIIGIDSRRDNPKFCQEDRTNLKSEKIKEKNLRKPDSPRYVQTALNKGMEIREELKIPKKEKMILFLKSLNFLLVSMLSITLSKRSVGNSGI